MNPNGRRPNTEADFWPRVDKTDTCWLWTARKNKDGYGQFDVGGRSVGAHRFAYETCIGEIPKHLECDHVCRVRHCVNPAHIELIPHAENVRRGEGGINFRGKTHCPRGHEYTKENTLVQRNKGVVKGRACRICGRAATVACQRRRASRVA